MSKYPKRKTIWHFASWVGNENIANYGDMVLGAAVQGSLSKQSPYCLRFVPIDIVHTQVFSRLIDKANDEADLILIGGGGFIDFKRTEKSQSGWQFDIATEMISRISAPIVVYGIGYNLGHYQGSVFSQSTIENIIELQRKSRIFSVRDTGTERYLIEMGLNSSKIQVIPDAAMFMNPLSIEIPALQRGKLKVGLNWTSDREQGRFPSPAHENRELLKRELTKALEIIAREFDAQIVLIPHKQRVDSIDNDFFREHLSNSFLSLEEIVPYLYPPSMVTAPFFVDCYRQMDMVIGMRGHSCIIPFGVGVPFMAIDSYAKTRDFLRDIDQEEYLIDLREFDKVCSAEEIFNRFCRLTQDHTYRTKTARKQLELQTIHEEITQQIIGLLTSD